MRLTVVMCGLPSAGDHGGAVAVWAIIRSARARGHDVVVCSLYDTSDENPYHAQRAANIAALAEMGVPVDVVEAPYSNLRRAALRADVSRFSLLRAPPVARYFPWALSAERVEQALRQRCPDAIFCYHFDALAAVYRTRIAPIAAGVGDLLHDPPRYRWALEPHPWRASCYEFVRRRGFVYVMQCLMRELLVPCAVRWEFVAHYAAWLRTHAELPDMRHLRVPVADPFPSRHPIPPSVQAEHGIRRVVLLGNLTGTASRWGQRFLAREVFPALDRLSLPAFKLHVIGQGNLDPHCAAAFDQRSYIVKRGYVDDLTRELVQTDAVIEPTPIPLGMRTRIITAWAHGCPVVTHAANQAGLPEIVDGENALVASDGPSFARAIAQLLNDPVLGDRLRVAARQTYDKFFTEERAGGVIVTMMEDAVIRVRS